MESAQRLIAISELYLLLLGRNADPEGLTSLFSSSESIEEIAQRIASSDECRALEKALARLREKLAPFQDSTKILLFGAYGNGNLGDREMPRCVEAIVRSHRDVTCFSFSDLRFADYDFCEERKLAHEDRPLNARALALFDGLVIGGGGLLSYTHEPLWDPGWASTAPIPYGLFACGVGTPLDPRLRPLVRRAAVASARDEEGVAALRALQPSSLHCADPILATYPCRSEPAPEHEGRPPRRLFVLRAPSHPWHAKVLASLAPGDDVAVFEAHQDFPIVYRRESARIVNTAHSFSHLLENYDLVVTERYHGAILSLLQGIPTYVISRDAHSAKLRELCSSLGLADCAYDIDHVPETFAPYAPESAVAAIQTLRAEASRQNHEFFEAFFAAVDRAKAAPSELRDPDRVARAIEALADGARSRRPATGDAPPDAAVVVDSDLLAHRLVSFQQEELKRLRGQIAEAEAALNRRAGAVLTDRPPDATLAQGVERIAAELAASQADRQSLDGEIQGLRAQLQAASRSLSRQSEENAALAGDLSASRRGRDALAEALAQAGLEIDRLRSRSDRAEDENAGLRHRLANSTRKSLELEACLSEERARRIVGIARE